MQWTQRRSVGGEKQGWLAKLGVWQVNCPHSGRKPNKVEHRSTAWVMALSTSPSVRLDFPTPTC